MKSKAFVRFLNRAARFDVDLELADLLASAAKAGRLSSLNSKLLFNDLDSARHPRLASHKPTQHQRQLVTAHLKATLCGAYIKDLFEDFSSYLLEIVTAAARAGLKPGRLIGEHRFEIDANEILACTSWPVVVQLVSTRLFRRLEDERSTAKLLQAIDKKLGLKISAKLVDAAMPFLELRHLLVHQDGVADNAFCNRFPIFNVKVGQRVRMTYAVTKNARDAITALAGEYDTAIIKADLLASSDTQP